MEPLTPEEVQKINEMMPTLSKDLTNTAIEKMKQGPEEFNPFIRSLIKS